MGPNEEKRRKWREHLHQLQNSRLSGAAYCRLHGLPLKSLAYWKRVLVVTELTAVNTPPKSEPDAIVPNFEEITSLVPRTLPQAVTTQPSMGTLRVQVGGRFCIEVDGDFSPAVLGRLVRTLEQLT